MPAHTHTRAHNKYKEHKEHRHSPGSIHCIQFQATYMQASVAAKTTKARPKKSCCVGGRHGQPATPTQTAWRSLLLGAVFLYPAQKRDWLCNGASIFARTFAICSGYNIDQQNFNFKFFYGLFSPRSKTGVALPVETSSWAFRRRIELRFLYGNLTQGIL